MYIYHEHCIAMILCIIDMIFQIRNNFLETDTCPFDQEFVYLCTKKFVRAVYQEIVVFIISKIV